MEPYVIRQGDYLLSLAHQFGFDADTVWNDPKNASLRQLRPNPNILFPGDVLYVPDQGAPPVMATLATGTTNAFVSSPPSITVSVKFVNADGTPCASMAYTIQELDPLTGLATDANGVATFQAPVTLATATVVFTDSGESRPLSIGGMDPIDTLSGIFQRLQNLGCIGSDVVFDSDNLDLLRVGLMSLKALQPGGDATDDMAPESVPSSAPTGAEDAPPSTPAAGDPAPSAGDASPNSAPPGSDPPPSGPSSSPGSSPSGPPPAPPVDDSGLSDDGTLSDDMKAMLLQSHGY